MKEANRPGKPPFKHIAQRLNLMGNGAAIVLPVVTDLDGKIERGLVCEPAVRTAPQCEYILKRYSVRRFEREDVGDRPFLTVHDCGLAGPVSQQAKIILYVAHFGGQSSIEVDRPREAACRSRHHRSNKRTAGK